jgi:hypothetical protein
MSDNEWDETAKRVAWDRQHGIPTSGSIAVQLAAVRKLLAEVHAKEAELEAWALSGDFVLAVPGEPVQCLIVNNRVLVAHSTEKPNG